MHSCESLNCANIKSKCSKCSQELFLTDFDLHHRFKNGHRSNCKVCRKQYRSNLYVSNTDHDCNLLKCNEIVVKTLCSSCNSFHTLNQFFISKSQLKAHESRCKYKSCLKGAKARNYEMNLTSEQFWVISQEPCFLCGKNETGYNGIDRFNNSKHYTVKNSVSMCRRCNMMKARYSFKDIFDWFVDIDSHMDFSEYKKRMML